MFDPAQLRRLAEIDTTPLPTLSLYLALDQPRETRLLSLWQMIRRQEQQMNEDGRKDQYKELAADLTRATRLVEELPAGPHKGLALFACRGRDLFVWNTLAVPVANLLQVGHAPYLRPLTALMADHCETIVAVLDRRRARFLHTCMGQTKELAELEIVNPASPSPRDGDKGRAGDSGLARKADQALIHYMKQVVAALMGLFKDKGCRELVVGGSRAGVDGLLGQLHPYLAQRLTGTFTMDMESGPSHIAEEAFKVQGEARLTRQADLLAGLAERLSPGGQAVAGLDQTLEALHKGQVRTLLIKRGHTHPGGSCPSCGRLSPGQGKCPTCQVDLAPVGDVVNLALAQALESGASLEQVPGKSALDELEGLAALLRYS